MGKTSLPKIPGFSKPERVGLLDFLHGPFYTGMGLIMPLSQFRITLYGPTSTSIHKEVATRFAGEDGMLIKFDHDRYYQHAFGATKGFDVSWISRS